MSEIPEIKCPECRTLMEYYGGPSNTNLFIMRCPTKNCGFEQTCYAESKKPKKEISIPCILNKASLGKAKYIFAILILSDTSRRIAYVPREKIKILKQPVLNEELKAELQIEVLQENNDTFNVSLIDGGRIEIIELQKKAVLKILNEEIHKAWIHL